MTVAHFRYHVRPTDMTGLEQIVRSSGYFNEAEIAVARELVEDRVAKGAASDYHFILYDTPPLQPVGYVCYGSVLGTAASYDLYWIAVSDALRHQKIGSRLLRETERLIRQAGGDGLYVETSGRPQYVSTRGFYERHHYVQVAQLPDFYGPGDDKIIYVKRLAAPAGVVIPS